MDSMCFADVRSAPDTDRSYRSAINKAALRHYMNNFDFSNLRLDQAFRFVSGCWARMAMANPFQETVR